MSTIPATEDNSISVQAAIFRDRGGAIIQVPTDSLGIQAIGGVLYQINPDGTKTALGGGGGGGITALTGDVTAAGTGSVAATIAAHAVTYAKMQQAGALTFLGNSTGGAADIAEMSVATARTVLGLAAVAISASAADLTTGTLAAARLPAFTGDITTSAGSSATTLKNTGPGAVTIGGGGTILASITLDVAGRVTAVTTTASGGGITALTGDVSATGPGSVSSTVGSVQTGVRVGAAGTGIQPSLRNPDSLANFAQLWAYPASGTNVGQSFNVIPRGTGFSGSIKANLSIYGTDLVADTANTESLLIRATGSAYNFLATSTGTGTLRPLNFQVGASVTSDTGINISATNNNVSVNSHYVAFARAGTAVTAQANGTVMNFAAVPPTQASGASVALNAYRWDAVTVTFTGTTAITTAAGVNFIDVEAPTYTDASALTITNAATLTIKDAPQAAGSVTLSNAYSLWTQAGAVRMDGYVNGSEFPALIFAAAHQQAIQKSGGAFVIGTSDSNTLSFQTNHTSVAQFDTSGNFIPLASATYDNGSGAALWNNLWCATAHAVNWKGFVGATPIGFTDNAGTNLLSFSSGAVTFSGTAWGVFGTNAAQQTGGAATATAVYTATEQSMLQKIYNMGRTFGFLT